MKLSRHILLFAIAVMLIFSSCSVTRYVGKDEYVVSSIEVNIKGNIQGISKSRLKQYIQQPQLRKLFGVPVYAYLYNIPNPAKDKARLRKKERKLQKKNSKIARRYDRKTAHIQARRNKYYVLYQKTLDRDSSKAQRYYQRYQELEQKLKQRKNDRPKELQKIYKKDIFTWWGALRKAGQKPPLYNPYLTEKSAEYIKNYLKAYGYYQAQVLVKKKTAKINPKKLKIIYDVYPGPLLIIDSVAYNIADTNINRIIRSNYDLQLTPGLPLQVKRLAAYRDKIVSYLKEHGYYYFTKDYITFTVDTLGRNYKAKVTVNIPLMKTDKGKLIPHPRLKIKNVYVFSDYNPNEALQNPREFFADCDTAVFYSSDSLPYYFIRKYQYVIRPRVLLREIYIKPNSLYRFSAIKNTYSHLTKFAAYKIVNIDLRPADTTNKYLNCTIELTPAKSQSVKGELVGTNSSATIGGAFNLTYEHRNIFHGGEIFSLQLHSALETQKGIWNTWALDSLLRFNTVEYSVDARMTIPRLLLPFRLGGFVEKSNPRTVLQLSYAYQDRPEYNRISLTSLYSYYWRANIFTNHILTLLRVSSVHVWDIIPEFEQLLVSSLLQESYKDYFIFGTSYSFTFSDQGQKKANNIYFQTNFSSSGNFLYLMMKLFHGPKNDQGSYYMPGFETVFAQFVKLDADFRVYHNFVNGNQLVWRFFGGVGVPFSNSKLLPFGERYFIGGSNSIRAWTVRSLGPGSYHLPDNVRFPNQTADIKLETNLEYRYPIVWKLEGALFLDAGNIWAINKYDYRPGALFRFNEFYKQLAIGTGTGLRLNFNFFVIRLDLGIKLYDPSAPAGYRFIPTSRPYNANDFVLNVAIGYPF